MRTVTAEFSPTRGRKRLVGVRMRMAPDRFVPTNSDPSEKLCMLSAGLCYALLKIPHQTNLKTEVL